MDNKKKIKQGLIGFIICFSASVAMSLLATKAAKKLVNKERRGV